MKQKSKNVLEFRKIIEQVESFAKTEQGKEKVRQIDATSDLEDVKYMQKETSEAYSIIMEKGRWILKMKLIQRYLYKRH